LRSFFIEDSSPISATSAIVSNSSFRLTSDFVRTSPFSAGACAAVVDKCDQIIQTAHGTLSLKKSVTKKLYKITSSMIEFQVFFRPPLVLLEPHLKFPLDFSTEIIIGLQFAGVNRLIAIFLNMPEGWRNSAGMSWKGLMSSFKKIGAALYEPPPP
jgi:hypothetical protein